MTPRINTRECWYAKYGEEGLMETAVRNHYSDEFYTNLVDNTRTGLFAEALFNIGKTLGVYTGRFTRGRMNKVTDNYRLGMERMIKVEGQTPDEVTKFIYEINNYMKLVPLRWGVYLEKPDGSFYFEDPMNTVIANCIRLGDELIDYTSLTEGEQLLIDKGLEVNNDKYIFKCGIEGILKGNAGSFTVGSKSHDDSSEYNITINYPLLIKGGKLFYPNQSNVSCTCPDQSMSVAKNEVISNKFYNCAHSIAALQELKNLGNRIKVRDLGHNYKFLEGGSLEELLKNEVLTMFSPLENNLMPCGELNPIFEQFNTYMLHERYAHESMKKYNSLKNWIKNMKRERKESIQIRRVDYEVMNKYFELLLNPLIETMMILGSDIKPNRVRETCYDTGNVMQGQLRTAGSKNPFIETLYERKPYCETNKVIQPLPVAPSVPNIIDLRDVSDNELVKSNVKIKPGDYRQKKECRS